jgi:dTDP-4-amino-4,6-dideoxygalactose transaminase
MPTYEQVLSFVDTIDKPQESVFLITHIGGWVNPDIEKIAELCRTRGISLIEDCAHSLGSTLNGKHTGLFGDAGVYSLYATKAVPAGEGGIIVTNDEDLYKKTAKYSIYDRFDQELDLGVNNRLSEVGALLCYSVLRETQAIIDNKYAIAEKYLAACDINLSCWQNPPMLVRTFNK